MGRRHMIRIEARDQISPMWTAIAAVAAGVLALAALAIVIAGTRTPILRGFELIATGAFGSLAALEQTVACMALLILAGLAAGLALRVKLYNFGAPGQMQAGALAALAVAGAVGLPAGLMLPLMLAAGACGGAILMLVPALLWVGRGTDTAVITLLFNAMMAIVVSALLTGSPAGPALAGLPITIPLPLFGPELGAYAGLFLAVLVAVLVFFMLDFTLWGFDIRATAGNPVAAGFAGIPVTAVLLRVGLMSGALAGLAGALMLALLRSRGIADFLPGLGYAGIVVAVLAALSPLAVVFAALFIGAVLTGVESMSSAIGLSASLADGAIGLMLIMALIGDALVRYRVRWIRVKAVAA